MAATLQAKVFMTASNDHQNAGNASLSYTKGLLNIKFGIRSYTFVYKRFSLWTLLHQWLAIRLAWQVPLHARQIVLGNRVLQLTASRKRLRMRIEGLPQKTLTTIYNSFVG